MKKITISPEQKKKAAILGGILLVVAGFAAFVFFDPLGFDLLGLKPTHPVIKAAPAPKARVATPKASPAEAIHAPAPATTPKVAPAPTPAAPPVVATKVATPATPSAAAPATSQPIATASDAKAPVATAVAVPDQSPQPSLHPAESVKPPHKTTARKQQPKPPTADLRECLKQTTDAAIAKCAGE